MTPASYICDDLSKVNICEQRSSLQEVGRHVNGEVAYWDVLSAFVGPYGVICRSAGFGYSKHCMARLLINSRML